jgi:hypothetical protein
MRLNIRIKILNYTLFGMIAKTQTVSGIISQLEFDKHIIMWDLDDCSLDEAKAALKYVQFKYNLSDIYIFGDKPDSHRAICFTVVSLMELLRIIIDTDYIDPGFVSYTAKRCHAAIRLSPKQGRPNQNTQTILESYPAPIPKKLIKKTYDTGIEKKGVTLSIGG